MRVIHNLQAAGYRTRTMVVPGKGYLVTNDAETADYLLENFPKDFEEITDLPEDLPLEEGVYNQRDFDELLFLHEDSKIETAVTKTTESAKANAETGTKTEEKPKAKDTKPKLPKLKIAKAKTGTKKKKKPEGS